MRTCDRFNAACQLVDGCAPQVRRFQLASQANCVGDSVGGSHEFVHSVSLGILHRRGDGRLLRTGSEAEREELGQNRLVLVVIWSWRLAFFIGW